MTMCAAKGWQLYFRSNDFSHPRMKNVDVNMRNRRHNCTKLRTSLIFGREWRFSFRRSRDSSDARGFCPPAAPLNIAQFLPATQTVWVGAPVGWAGDAPHPRAGRQIFCTMQGEYEVTASDGTIRAFPVGSVILLEDTTGKRHSTRVTSQGDALIFAVVLANPD